MHWSFLSDYTQAVVSSLLLIAVFALFPARFGSLARWVALVLGAALVDQGAKALILLRARDDRYFDSAYLGGWLHLTYFQNDALGFDYSFPFLLLSTLTFVLALAVLYQRLARAHYRMSTLMEVGLALMAGGLLGILLDRARLKYVVDFLEFGPHANYVYNLADLFTILGGVLALTRFGELGTYVRIGLRRSMPRMGEADDDPPPPRLRRSLLRVLSLCAVSAVALCFMWQVGVVRLPPLHAAAQRGDLKRVQRLLRQGAGVNRLDTQGQAPLHYAAQSNHQAVAELLLSKGARVNQPNAEGMTPLHCAMMFGADLALTKSLLARGADVHARSNHGGAPMDFATFHRPEAVPRVQLLLDHGAEISEASYHHALILGDPRLVKLLLEHGAAKTAAGWEQPPLLRAAWVDQNAPTLKMLLEAGEDVRQRDREGRTALHQAVQTGDAKMVQVLLEGGAEVDARNHNSETPLLVVPGRADWASSRAFQKDFTSSRSITAQLLAHGANPNARSKTGWTPLARASSRGDATWVEVLLKAGAQVNAKCARGWTPLHYAAAKGYAEVVKMLLAAGANPSLQNDEGATPGELAKDEKVKALLRAR